jgi:hypothetical protein
LDEGATGVPDAMAALCAQFARQGRPLKVFDRIRAARPAMENGAVGPGEAAPAR